MSEQPVSGLMWLCRGCGDGLVARGAEGSGYCFDCFALPKAPCPECVKAQTAPCHVYMAGCPTCQVRAISESPKEVRERFYETIPDATEREAFKVAVGLEYRRRKEFQP